MSLHENMRGKRGKPEKPVGNYKSGCMGASYTDGWLTHVRDHRVNNTRVHCEINDERVQITCFTVTGQQYSVCLSVSQ